MEYRALGPLELRDNDRVVEVNAGKLRVVLAVLLLHANHNVTIDELIEALWCGTAPANARAVVQKYVMRVRRIVGGDVIATVPDGYRMVIPTERFDLDRFHALVAEADVAAAAAEPDAEAETLRRALELWSRRTPLSNVPSDAIARTEVPRLTELYLATLERCVDIDLRRGRHREVVGELMTLVREHPLRERFWSQWMTALHGAGRTSEALSAYQEVTSLLAEELGVGPGRELREVHDRILREDAETAETAERAAVAVRPSVPHQLPIASSGFVGRRVERDEVTGLLGLAADQSISQVILLTGPAGVGKTTLAVRAAHQVAGRFPDGQLYCDLRAHSPGLSLTVGEALGQFLHALGLPTETIPITRPEQIATFRSMVAGKRVLVVLDNVGSEEVVRELLPGSGGSAAIVTSRNELAGLMVDPGAHRVGVDVLSADESRELLVRALGERRVSGDQAAVRELISLCGGLALALRLAAAHMVSRPTLSVSEYALQLRRHGALSQLRVDGDERADLASAFGWSYAQLPADRQRLLRLMSLIADTDFSVRAACAVLGSDEAATSAQLEELAAASLLMRHERRYRFHDLIRRYARQQSMENESHAERVHARERLLDHYIAKTDLAVRPVLRLSRLPATPIDPRCALEEAPTLASIDEDRLAMVAAVRAAAAKGPFEKACHLADALRGYFTLRGHAVDWHATVEAGLRAAEHERFAEGIAAMLNSRGALRYHAGDVASARQDLTNAVERYDALGSIGANAVRINLGIIAQMNGDLDESVAYQEDAMLGYQAAGEDALEMRARQNLVLALREQGDLSRACAEARTLEQNSANAADSLSLGTVAALARFTGDLRHAAVMLSSAAEVAASRGDRRLEVGLLDELANCRIDMGEADEAYRIVTENITGAERDDPRNLPYVQTTLAKVLHAQGEIGRARRQFQYALNVATEMDDVSVQCDALTSLADLELTVGDTLKATQCVARVVALAGSSGRRLSLVDANVVLAGCWQADGRLPEALALADEALRMAQDCSYPMGQARAWERLARICMESGDGEAARQNLRQAASLYARLRSTRVTEVREHLEMRDNLNA